MIREFEKRFLTSLILIPLSIFFIVKGSILLIFFLSILFLAASNEWVLMSKKNNLFRFLGIIFLFFSFYSAHEFRENENYKDFLFIITICIFTDIGGYIFGKFFKGPKLIKISPNKTYAGVFGGFLLAVVAGLVYDNFYSPVITVYLETFINYSIEMQLLIFILIISLVSQIGDLIISYFKRLAKVKDTGKLFPGHGGVLDRVDGIIFAIPTSYLLFNFLI